MRRRRSVFVVVAIAAILVAISAITVLRATVLVRIDAAQQAALSAAVDTDLVGLADIYASGGRDELARRLDDRLAFDRVAGQHLAAYRLEDGSGRRIAGGLPADVGRGRASPARLKGAPVTLGGLRGWQRATALPGDLVLVVAHADPAAGVLREAIDRNFVIVGVAIIAIVALLAIVAAAKLRRRIARISEAIADRSNLADGGQGRSRFSGDEIDLLAERSAQLVAREKQLTDAYKTTADTIAHEIRTPLAHLDGRLRQFASTSSDEGRGELVIAARRDVRSIVAMLESLLDIAASEAHVGRAEGLTPVDLSALIDDLIEVYRASFDDAGLEISARIAAEVIVPGDSSQLRRLVSNLFDNAVRYVPAGGRISVTLSPGPRLSIADDGPGIPERVHARLFDRFSSGSGGHGLGLALVRAIVQRHGWEIKVVTGENGTMFEIGRG